MKFVIIIMLAAFLVILVATDITCQNYFYIIEAEQYKYNTTCNWSSSTCVSLQGAMVTSENVSQEVKAGGCFTCETMNSNTENELNLTMRDCKDCSTNYCNDFLGQNNSVAAVTASAIIAIPLGTLSVAIRYKDCMFP